MLAVAIVRTRGEHGWEVQYADFPEIVGRAGDMFGAVSAASGLLDTYLEGLVGGGGTVPVLRPFDEVNNDLVAQGVRDCFLIEIEMPEY